MISLKLSQIYKQYSCSIFKYFSYLLFYMKPDTINIIISGNTDQPFNIDQFIYIYFKTDTLFLTLINLNFLRLGQ